MGILDRPIYIPKPGQPGYIEIKPDGAGGHYVDSRKGVTNNTSIEKGCVRCGFIFRERGECPMFVPVGDCFNKDACKHAKKEAEKKGNAHDRSE